MAYVAGSMINMNIVWLVAIVVLLIVEAIVPGLVSIWFALGALAALIAALAGAPLGLQVIWFLVVSILALALTRPLAKKYINAHTTPTNADMLLGRECVVKETIDNLIGTGSVFVEGKMWSARMCDDHLRALPGEIVIAERIEGVKLIVHPKDNN